MAAQIEESRILTFTALAKSLVLWGDVVNTLVDEDSFRVTDGALEVKFVDPAHVAMGVARLKPATSLDGMPTEDVGLDFLKLVDRVKLLDQKDYVDVRVEAATPTENGGGCRLKQGRFQRTVSVLDPAQYADPRLPAFTETTRAIVDLDAMKKGLKMANQVSDHVIVTTRDGEVLLIAEGDTDRDEIVVGDLLPDAQEARSLYSIDYLSKFVATLEKLNDNATLVWATNQPLVMETGETKHGVEAKFLLAPRMETPRRRPSRS